MSSNLLTDDKYSIVALDKFIQATRDSGYKGTTSAISELVDNSIQSGATEICITLAIDDGNSQHPILVQVKDNGCGMDDPTLRQSLRFGGSTRFNNREGLGRYGMGLPNSSFSQAQRVTVATWTSPGQIIESYLDLDEIASGFLTHVPIPREIDKPSYVNGQASGTVVTWQRCDRLDNRRVSTLCRKLLSTLGRRFRYPIWEGVKITINGDLVEGIDPLYLNPNSIYSGASQFGSESIYEVHASPHVNGKTGFIRVRFSELPVREWSKLSNKEKRVRGITKGAGVSIIRAGREVDYGWFFLGGKRRENYDDWWRCEVQFEPILDEAFGITHTKQQARPQPHLVEILSADIETAARALNNRARAAHSKTKIEVRFSASENIANAVDDRLTPIPNEARSRDTLILEKLDRAHPVKKQCNKTTHHESLSEVKYKIIQEALSETTFFNYARDEGQIILILNPEHPFYKQVYKPLLESEDPHDITLRTQIALLLMSSARSEALLENDDQIQLSESLRKGWSDTLATFLNG